MADDGSASKPPRPAHEAAPDKPRKPARQPSTNNDAELARSFLVGCGVLFVVFLIGSGLIAYFWLL